MNVYRFRSMEYLLGDKYQELEKQAIYFASPDQLNDPIEGFRDVVWSGDKIVWTNLFKNYVWCLNAIYPLHRTINDSMEIDADKIPILGLWDKLPIPEKQRFNSIWHRFHNLPKVSDMIEALANANREIRYRELEYYLRWIQQVILVQIIALGIDYQFIPESEKQQLTAEISNVAKESLEPILTLLALLEKAETREKVNALLREKEELLNNERVNRQLKNLDSEGKLENMDKLFFDFPKKYLNGVERLLGPNWYIACFMKNYHNSSVWGNYGDKHSGVCLIFETEKMGSLDSFQLYQMTDEDVKTMIPKTLIPFNEVSYADKPGGEVNFFRSIGRFTAKKLMKLWYIDEEGNISECAAHLLHHNDTFNWRDNYWDSFYRDITTKTKDWKHEQEYRLILRDDLGEYDEKENRTLSYNFNSLKGIIFGMKTSDEHKLRIIDIIQRKCEENNRMDFKFYQAEYSPENGNIRKYKIQLL